MNIGFTVALLLSPSFQRLSKSAETISLSSLLPTCQLYKLADETKPLGLPVAAFEHLYLSRGSGVKQINTLSDLKGSVRIDSADKALEFVRLRTSPKTKSLWKHQASLLEVHAEPESFRAYSHSADGHNGAVFSKPAQDELKRLFSVSKKPSGFEITRPVVRSSVRGQGPFEAALLVEQVGTDGAYRVLRLRRIQSGSFAKISWYITMAS